MNTPVLLYLSFYIMVTGLFSELDQGCGIKGALSIAVLGIVLAFAIALFWQNVFGSLTFSDPPLESKNFNLSNLKDKLSNYLRLARKQWITKTAILLPIWVYLLFTWNQEFPFIGDHDHHIMAAKAALGFWQRKISWIVILVFALWYLRQNTFNKNHKEKMSRIFWILGIAAIFIWSFKISIGYYFARYPAGVYFFVAPLQWLGELLNTSLVTNAGRVVTVLFASLLIFTRKNSLFILPLFFWNPDWIYYFTTNYLDPVAFTLIFIGLENISQGLQKNSMRSIQSGFLMVCLASAFKDTAILWFPFAWLGVLVGLWHSNDSGVHKSQKTVYRLMSWLGLGFTGLIPFVFYILIRKKFGISRSYEWALPWSSSDSILYFNEWLFRTWTHGGLVLFIWLVICVCVIYHQFKSATRINQKSAFWTALLLGSYIFQNIFYFFDKNSISWLGLPRFTLIAEAGLLIILGVGIQSKGWFKLVIFALCAAQGLRAFPMLLDLRLPNYNRNFIEHYDGPRFLPVNQLIELFYNKHPASFKTLSKIVFLSPKTELGSYDFELGYPSLKSRFKIERIAGNEGLETCLCGPSNQATVLLGIKKSGIIMNRESTWKHLESFDHWQPAGLKLQTKCYEKLKHSCSKFVEVIDQNQVLGFLGVK